MTDSFRNQLSDKVESLWSYSGVLGQSINLFRLIGYGLLILATIDLVDIFFPPQFTNPAWEFTLVGQIVERVAVPLIGIGLVFMGQQSRRQKREKLLLRIISWLTLVVAILFIILVPLGVMSAVRIDRQNTSQLAAQVEQATGSLEEAQLQADNITSIEQARTFLSNLTPQSGNAVVQTDEPISLIKDKIAASLSEGKRRIESQADAAKKSQRRTLFKNTVKWGLGSVLSSALFFSVWRCTDWARRKQS